MASQFVDIPFCYKLKHRSHSWHRNARGKRRPLLALCRCDVLLIWPSEHANPPVIMQALEERIAKFHSQEPGAELAVSLVPQNAEAMPTVHHHAHHRVWQRKFYGMNIWRQKKRLEKNHMHNNPSKAQAGEQSREWPWSSWRFYNLGDASIRSMDPMS